MLEGSGDVARVLLVGVMAAASLAKFVDLPRFGEALTAILGAMGIARRPVSLRVAAAVPGVELLAASALVAFPSLGAALVIGLLATFSLAAIVLVRTGRSIECACFGPMSRAPLGLSTAIRNGPLIACGALVLFGTPNGGVPELPVILLGLLLGQMVLVLDFAVPRTLLDVAEVSS